MLGEPHKSQLSDFVNYFSGLPPLAQEVVQTEGFSAFVFEKRFGGVRGGVG